MTKVVKKKDFLEYLIKSGGNISLACRNFNLSRETFYRWLKEDDFKKEYENTQEDLIDFVEGRLMKEINEGNITAIIFFLKCKAKHRGYIERQEVSGMGGEPIKVQWMS